MEKKYILGIEVSSLGGRGGKTLFAGGVAKKKNILNCSRKVVQVGQNS